jgi:hypothetical protein
MVKRIASKKKTKKKPSVVRAKKRVKVNKY